MRGRLEITADLRNLLAEGYLPLSSSNGRRALLLHTPRSVRGGFFQLLTGTITAPAKIFYFFSKICGARTRPSAARAVW